VDDLTFLRTCKQIRHEATPFFYSISTFQTYCVTDIFKLSSTSGCGKILELQIDRFNAYEIAGLWQAWEYEIENVDTCLQQHKSLRRVYMHFPQGCMAYEKHQIEEGIRAGSPHAEFEVIVTEDLEDDDLHGIGARRTCLRTLTRSDVRQLFQSLRLCAFSSPRTSPSIAHSERPAMDSRHM
jgi:hypothetical protein